MTNLAVMPHPKARVEVDEDLVILVELVVGSLSSENTKRRYDVVLRMFLQFMRDNGLHLCRASLIKFLDARRQSGWSASSINQAITIIRRLAIEANAHGIISDQAERFIKTVKNVRCDARKTGTWLTKEQVAKLLSSLNLASASGLRDFVLVGLMVGAGLRRGEVIGLRVDQVRLLNGRLAIFDLLGKGNKYRTVPLPAWLSAAITDYRERCAIREGYLLRRIVKTQRGYVVASNPEKPLAGNDVWRILQKRCESILGISPRPHDMRRSFARLAYLGGADMEQLRITLGHGSMETTERYVAPEFDPDNPVCDNLGLPL